MTDVSGRNRVQAGVPTGGQFATGTRGENGDLVVADGPDDDLAEQSRRIAAALQAALQDGTLKSTPTFVRVANEQFESFGERYYVDGMPVGRDTEGTRVLLNFQAIYINGPRTTQDLRQVDGYWAVNLSAHGIRKGDRNPKQGGGLGHFTSRMPGDTEADELAHLPRLNSDYADGTEEQVAQYREIMDSATSGDPRSWMAARQRADAEIADDRGHRWGEKLLVPSDADSVERALDLLRSIKARKRKGQA